MSKKSFKDNPALQFITVPKESAPAERPAPVSETPAEYTAPAMPFHPDDVLDEIAPRPEPRSRRLNLLIQPSLHEKLVKLSNRKGVSLNQLIHTALEHYADSGR